MSLISVLIVPLAVVLDKKPRMFFTRVGVATAPKIEPPASQLRLLKIPSRTHYPYSTSISPHRLWVLRETFHFCPEIPPGTHCIGISCPEGGNNWVLRRRILDGGGGGLVRLDVNKSSLGWGHYLNLNWATRSRPDSLSITEIPPPTPQSPPHYIVSQVLLYISCNSDSIRLNIQHCLSVWLPLLMSPTNCSSS